PPILAQSTFCTIPRLRRRTYERSKPHRLCGPLREGARPSARHARSPSPARLTCWSAAGRGCPSRPCLDSDGRSLYSRVVLEPRGLSEKRVALEINGERLVLRSERRLRRRNLFGGRFEGGGAPLRAAQGRTVGMARARTEWYES